VAVGSIQFPRPSSKPQEFAETPVEGLFLERRQKIGKEHRQFFQETGRKPL
jgi:hypothetical protein